MSATMPFNLFLSGPSCHHCLIRVKSVNDHRDHMVQGYSQQPCTM
ncbi:unnamed protein product [Staurois parvus]|uniref:Uncharacterized protein n=1 Tax=Staurois parvus TaxID=386267 RepID=A0ABN9FYW3_9NEOB|nr:unnamed protein product [Staurois parvus]